MRTDSEEPGLPYTPSHTGRGSRVGYLGLEGVGFNELWPVFAGLVASLGLALRFFVAEPQPGAHWLLRTVESFLPVAAGFGYLRLLVAGRPPHFKADLWATLLGVRVDFTDPPVRGLPILPRIYIEATAAGGPQRACDAAHPLRRTRSRPRAD